MVAGCRFWVLPATSYEQPVYKIFDKVANASPAKFLLFFRAG